MQPVCTAIWIPYHAGWGLAGHPRCVNVGNDYGKTSLYTPIRSKTTTFPRCAHHHSAQREHSGQVMNLLEKGAIEIVPPAQSEPGFYSRYFLVPKKYGGLRPILDLRLLNYALMKKVVQVDHFETDPPTNMPRGLVHVAGSERRIL